MGSVLRVMKIRGPASSPRRRAPIGPALLLLLGGLSREALAAGVSIETATAEQTARASDRFRAGAEALEAQKLDEALALFRESYDVVASPNSRLMIGRTLARQGKTAEAYLEIQAAVNDAEDAARKNEKYRKTAQAARTELAELRPKVGFVLLRVAGAVSVGGREIADAIQGDPIVATPGTTEIVVRLAGGSEQKVSVEVRAGESTTVDLAPTSAPSVAHAPAAAATVPAAPPPAGDAEPRGIPHMTLAWVAGGIGLAGFATFGVFGLMNQSTYSDLEERCPGGLCPRSASEDAERGRTYQTLANVGLGVGVVGLGSGLVLALTAPGKKGSERAESTPSLVLAPRGVTVRGRF
jgi:hypothetical protein